METEATHLRRQQDAHQRTLADPASLATPGRGFVAAQAKPARLDLHSAKEVKAFAELWNHDKLGLDGAVETVLTRSDLPLELRHQIHDTLAALKQAHTDGHLAAGSAKVNTALNALMGEMASLPAAKQGQTLAEATQINHAMVTQRLAELERAAQVIGEGHLKPGTRYVIGAKPNQQMAHGLPNIEAANVEADGYYMTVDGVLHLDEVKATPNALTDKMQKGRQFGRYETWAGEGTSQAPRQVGVYVRDSTTNFHTLLRGDRLNALSRTFGGDAIRAIRIGNREFTVAELRVLDADASQHLAVLQRQHPQTGVGDLLKNHFNSMEQTFRELGKEYGQKAK